jgi:Fe-S cluster assembly protein SufB
LEKDKITLLDEKISLEKNEPEFLRKFRNKAFASWKKKKSPLWASLEILEIDYDNIQYYSVPKTKKKTGKFR